MVETSSTSSGVSTQIVSSTGVVFSSVGVGGVVFLGTVFSGAVSFTAVLAGAGAGAAEAVFGALRETDFAPPKPTLPAPRELSVRGFFVVIVGTLFAGCCIPIGVVPIANDGVKEGTDAISFLAQEGVNSPADARLG